jgi:hypothetical protein
MGMVCVQCVAQTVPYVGVAAVALGVMQHRARQRRLAGADKPAEPGAADRDGLDPQEHAMAGAARPEP